MTQPASDDAPGQLDLLRLFVNTFDFPNGPDRIGDLAQASAWCGQQGLPSPTNQAELERLRGFREALRAALFANNGEADPREAWEALAPYAQAAQLRITLDPAGGPRLEPAGAGDRAVAKMLAIVYDAVADRTWPRLRACRKSSCQYAYYDRSKNASRAWCSMAVCGNREKAHRRRSRDRAL